MDTEKLQKQHFDSIASEYAKHYGDVWSQAYREKYINAILFKDIPISGMKILDAMCGDGETTEYLLHHGAHVTGIDISQESIRHFQERWQGCSTLCASILSTGIESNTYDRVVVVGGLHHLHPNVSKAIQEIYRVLKPGGYFCFAEPHQESFSNLIRRFWYRHDKLFAANEAAIDLESLKREWSSKFKFHREEYKGNIAYLFVLNTLILRIPISLKSLYSPFLIWLESKIEKIQTKKTSCFVMCQWEKL